MTATIGIKKGTGSYKNALNYDALRRDNQANLRNINNIFIETELSVNGLQSVLKDVVRKKGKNIERFHISAPTSKGKVGNISRKIDDVIAMLEQRIDAKEYIQSLVFAVSYAEDYISKTLVRVIRAYPSNS